MVNTDLFRYVPKADFHCHAPLAGSFDAALAHLGDVPRPPQYTGFAAMESYITRYLTPHLKRRPFFEHAVRVGFDVAVEDGVVGVELTLSVAHRAKYGGLLSALTSSVRQIAASAAPNCYVRIYAGLRREYGSTHFEPIADHLVPENGFDGIDLTGDELSREISDFQFIFQRAGGAGLRRKAHVGERGSADDVLRAVEVLELDAVQHGIVAADSRSVVSALARDRIPLHLAPESSAHVRNDRDGDRKRLRQLLDGGVAVTIGSDDFLLFDQSISEQLAELVNSGIMTEREARSLLSDSVTMWETGREPQLTRVQSLRVRDTRTAIW